MLISEEINQYLDGFFTRFVGKFVFKGKSKSNRVYELVSSADSVDLQRKKAYYHFSHALTAFHRQSWDVARESFHRVETLIGPDGPSKFYLNLCDRYSKNSPEADWDGTIHLQEK